MNSRNSHKQYIERSGQQDYQLVRLADQSWLKILFADSLWEKNIVEWLADSAYLNRVYSSPLALSTFLINSWILFKHKWFYYMGGRNPKKSFAMAQSTRHCTLWNMSLQLIYGVIVSASFQEFPARDLVFVFVSLLIFRTSNGIPYCSWGSVLGWAEGSAWSADMNRCRSFETSLPRGVSSWPYVRHEAHIGLELESLTREAHTSLTTWPTLLIRTCACMRRICAVVEDRAMLVAGPPVRPICLCLVRKVFCPKSLEGYVNFFLNLAI